MDDERRMGDLETASLQDGRRGPMDELVADCWG
jgi:hypothetical protein